MLGPDNLRSLAGVALILAFAWLLGEGKRRMPWRVLVGAFALQVGVLALAFGLPAVRASLSALNGVVDGLMEATLTGSRFVFGYLAGGDQPFTPANPQALPILAFQVFPLVIVISVLSAVLWHWRVLDYVCRGLGLIFRAVLGLSGPLSLATAANIFLGMVEAPLTIRPYLDKLSRADLFVVMTTGLATVAGTVMAIFAIMLRPTLPDAAAHILLASLLAAPASVLIARLMIPERESAEPAAALAPYVSPYHSGMDAFAAGAEEGVKMMINIIGMLLAAVAVVALLNIILAGLAPAAWGAPLSVERMLGWGFAPLMWLIGVPWSEAAAAGALMGVKTVLNEFLAFAQLAAAPADQISERTRLILTYALCGFANFGSVAIMTGGLCAICPDRRQEIAELSLKAMLSGTLTTCMTAALVGAASGFILPG